MELKIISNYDIFYKESVDSIHLKTIDGDLTILAKHLPLVAKVSECLLTYSVDKVKYQYLIGEGLVVVKDDVVKVIADYFKIKE